MLDEVSSPELTEWMEFYKIDPWGELRADRRSAIQCTIAANAAKGKKGKAAKPTDFMEFPEDGAPPRKQQTPEEMRFALMKVAAFMGAPLPPTLSQPK